MADDDSQPSTSVRWCDVVMKGGITSGVVYPLAICELARSYRFRNIGGTSAGAIAAAATSAAELGRDGPHSGFERLASLPAWLGGDEHLFSLFQPQPRTRPLFALLTAGMGRARRWRKASRIVGAAVRGFWPWLLAGAVPGIALAALAALTEPGGIVALRVYAMACGALLAVGGGAIGLAAGVIRHTLREIPANGFGLSKGFDASERSDRPGLARWLETELDALAGRPDRRAPLTFRDLWGHRAGGEPLAPGERRINLQMMTTNLTHGRPYRMPFEQRGLFFDPDELRTYFPEAVVQWMVDHATDGAVTPDGRRVLGMPEARELPVIVATRLSLSFPFLISAVPLYAVDWGRPDAKKREVRLAERCWFSDGGICSNFPVHFFDALLPRWPTFAINLRPFTRFRPRDTTDEGKNVYMPRRNGEGLDEWWNRFDENPADGSARSGAGKITGFVAAILDSARNWRDNTQARVPGYRDRVVHVKLDPSVEGGLNLRMPPEVITRLTDRGHRAGQLLRHRFADLPQDPKIDISWANHRWVRYRNAMSLINDMLHGIREAFNETAPGDVSYASLISRADDEPPRSYRWSSAQRTANPHLSTDTLLRVIDSWDAGRMDFRPGSPRPTPEFRVTPRI